MIELATGSTIEDALKQATLALAKVSDTAKLDAELLLAHCLQRDRTYLVTWPERVLTDAQSRCFISLVAQRQIGHPIAHILGQREFWSLPLQVNNSTLIPRPDTEVLVEQALSLPLPNQANVLDLGTGTGAIALALKQSKPNWQVVAVDRMPEAVELARHNAERLQLTIAVYQSYWFEQLTNENKFDLVVSNPPYIDAADPHLEQGDVRFEPRSALVADNDGLADIEHIIATARNYITATGWLIIEHGFQQAEAVRKLFTQCGYENVRTVKDYGQLDRVTMGQRSSNYE